MTLFSFLLALSAAALLTLSVSRSYVAYSLHEDARLSLLMVGLLDPEHHAGRAQAHAASAQAYAKAARAWSTAALLWMITAALLLILLKVAQ